MASRARLFVRPQYAEGGKHRAPGFLVKIGSTTDPDRRASLMFGLLTAAGAILGVLVVAALAFFSRPHAAVLVLGLGMVVMGVLRGLWPGRPWFSSRNRWLDALVYTLVGVAILILAPWTASLPPGG